MNHTIDNKVTSEAANAQIHTGASIGKPVDITEQAHAEGIYTFTCTAPKPEFHDAYVELLEKVMIHASAKEERAQKFTKQIATLESASFLKRLLNLKTVSGLKAEMAMTALLDNARLKLLNKQLKDIPTYVKWEDTVQNLVATGGKNDALDKYLAGSAYTATWFLGLITLTSYTAVAATDTMASHAGWLEAGGTNAPIYSQGARPTAAWSAASAGAKALSAALAFTIATTGGTIKGCFLTSVATKDGTTGILYSAGLFTGGDKIVNVTDVLNVSYTASL